MSTLTEAAIFSKKASIWSVIALAVIIFLMIFFGIAGNVKNALFPPPPLPPPVAFGKLPKMDLSDGYKAPGNITYSLETVSGDLPVLPSSEKVFEIESRALSFGTLEEFKTKAALFKFMDAPLELSDGRIKFVDSQDPERTLVMEKITGNFELSSNYATNQTIITTRPDSLESAVSKARSFFDSFGLLISEFPKEKIKTKFQRIDGNSLTEVQSLSSANLVEVDFFRTDLDKLPVLWPKETSTLATALVSMDSIVAADLNLMPIRKSSFATYPLKGAAKAFEDLKAGAGAFTKPIKTTNIVISDVKLGYVESSKNQQYLEPVYLFYSRDEQIGYVGAVSDQWLR